MTPAPVSDPSVLCTGILQYLQDHPEAADSLEGITDWWLPPEKFSVTTKAVQEALDLLVSQHRIARIDLADGRTLFQSVEKVSGAHLAWKPPTPRN